MIDLFAAPPFGVPRAEKEPALLARLNDLTARHIARSPAYRRLLEVTAPAALTGPVAASADVPWLPVGLFKSHTLHSLGDEAPFKVLTSSGTTGQAVSRIYLDAATAARQTEALARIMRTVFGPKRLPMLIIDTRDLLKDRRSFSARGAGVLGMSTFGHSHVYALNPDMTLDRNAVERFLLTHGGGPFAMFGFTFMVWRYFFREIEGAGLDLSNGVLVHSGGWKKLIEEAVSNDAFKARFKAACGLSRIYNFYGMVEQVGSVFLEGDDGLLYPPAFADVIVRDPVTWAPAPHGTPGVIEVLSVLPESYPGHALLTEDLGVIEAEDAAPDRMGKGFRVLGRVPRAELRGCSDTHAYGRAA